MDLQTYWLILVRRWWLPAAVTLLTAVISVATSPLAQGGYNATVRVLLGVPSEAPRGIYFTYDKYYSLLSTEYITDDFIEVVRSKGFLEDVRRQAAIADTSDVVIASQPRSERAPRVLTVTIASSNEADTQKVATTAADFIVNRSGDYFPGLGAKGIDAKVIDPPVVTPASAGGRALLNVALRTGLGLVVGLALAFLLHYLDTTLYDGSDVRRHLSLPLLGELPAVPDPADAA